MGALIFCIGAAVGTGIFGLVAHSHDPCPSPGKERGEGGREEGGQEGTDEGREGGVGEGHEGRHEGRQGRGVASAASDVRVRPWPAGLPRA